MSHCFSWIEEIEKTRSRRNTLKLFAVKPLLVIYMMSWAVTSSVGTQLWLFRTCRNYYNQTGEGTKTYIILNTPESSIIRHKQ